MSKSNWLENQLLQYIFNAVTPDFSTDTEYFLTLHTDDPGDAGDQSTNEIVYTGFARVAVARDSGGWTVVADTVTNAAPIQFPTCSSGSVIATHASIGRLGSGAGDILYKGALNSPLSISVNKTPIIQTGEAALTEA